MQRGHRSGARWALVASILALGLPLVACETKNVTVRIAGFGAGDVDGIWLWRRSDTSGQYERACRIDLSDAQLNSDGEYLGYIQDCVHNHPGIPLTAPVVRLAISPDTVTVDLWYMRWEDSGTYKASAFNAAGESALSTSVAQL